MSVKNVFFFFLNEGFPNSSNNFESLLQALAKFAAFSETQIRPSNSFSILDKILSNVQRTEPK